MNTNDKSLDAPASHPSHPTGDQSPTTGPLSLATGNTASVTSPLRISTGDQLPATELEPNSLILAGNRSRGASSEYPPAPLGETITDNPGPLDKYRHRLPDGTVLWFYDPNSWWNAPTIKTAESLTEALRATDWFKIKRDQLYPWSLPSAIQFLPPSERPGYLSGRAQHRPRYLPGKENGSFPICLVCEQVCYPERGYSSCCHSQLITDEGLVFISLGFLPRGTRKPRVATHRSGYKHVCYLAANKGWSARIKCKGFEIYNGTFDTPEDAARAADNLLYALWHSGKVGGNIMGRMNFPEVYFGPLTTLQLRAPYGRTEESLDKFLNWINQKEKNAYLEAYCGKENL